MKIIKQLKRSKIKLGVLVVFSYQLLFPNQALATEPQRSILLPNLTVKSANFSQNIDENDKDDRIFLISIDGVTKIDNSQKSSKISQESINQPAIGTAVKAYNIKKTYHIPITAYSSTPDQTWGDPCITANGFNVCDHNTVDVIAANFLPFGTKVQIPEYFGDRIFTVQDRMNSRYYYRADIWMQTRQDAKNFGIKYTDLVVLE